MPYDTRRKSLSLPSLGIQLPNASRAHRHSNSKASPTRDSASPPQQPPTKRVKRSHTLQSSSPPQSPPPRSSTGKNVTFADRPKSSRRGAYDDTPPASPEPTSYKKYDTSGINDDIVAGVIEQLEKTGNRPHMIRELATVISTTNDAVATSANPGALLSSRLAAYIKRTGWSALSPCPIDKELTEVHPRKIYYYLTTMPRQTLPTDSSGLFVAPNAAGKGGKRIISPSVSSASVDEDIEAAEERKRSALSPSPEVDLSTHDEVDINARNISYDVPGLPSYSSRSSLPRDGSQSEGLLPQRTASPPLEGDEREFTQTASSVRMRGMSLDGPSRPSIEVIAPLSVHREETEEEKAARNREVVEALFGGQQSHLMSSTLGSSSPMVKPMQLPIDDKAIKREPRDDQQDVEMQDTAYTSVLGGHVWDLKDESDIGIEDLDDLFGAC